jgi:hypothetical protein
MNTIAIIILLAIFIDLILNGLADYFNLKMLREDLPDSFRGIYEPERYRQSQDYLRVNTRFGWHLCPEHYPDFNILVRKRIPAAGPMGEILESGTHSNGPDIYWHIDAYHDNSVPALQRLCNLCD